MRSPSELPSSSYRSLVRLDKRSRIIPDLAEGWETPNNLTYIFRLKPGVRFHHGAELTAEDVKFTFDSVRDPATKSPHLGGLEKLARVEVLGRYTVAFYLKEPFAPFLANAILGIVPKELAQNSSGDFSRRPIGSGPFQLQSWRQDERLELSPFNGSAGEKPKLERVILRIIPDATVRLLELEKGTLDLVVGAVPPEALPRLKKVKGLKVLETEGSSYTYLGFNLRDPVLKKQTVREAIACAINREEIVEALLNGQATLATGLLPPWHWAYEPQVRRYPYDPERAKRLLDEAGYPIPHGPGPRYRFTLTYKTTTSDLARAVGEVLQEQLGRVGIQLTIRTYEWGTFYADVKSGNFQLYLLTWVGIVDPDIYHHYTFHSGSVPPKGANRGHYVNPELDRLIERGRTTLDQEERKRIYSQVQKLVAEDLPYVSLWHPRSLAVLRERVHGFRLYPSGDFTPLEDTWLITPD